MSSLPRTQRTNCAMRRIFSILLASNPPRNTISIWKRRLRNQRETDVCNHTRCIIFVPLTPAERQSHNPRHKDKSLYDEENNSRERVLGVDGRYWAWKLAFVVEFTQVHYQSISYQSSDLERLCEHPTVSKFLVWTCCSSLSR